MEQDLETSRDLREILKDFMLTEKEKEADYISLLKDQVSDLRLEIHRKNNIIEEQITLLKTVLQQKDIRAEHETSDMRISHSNEDVCVEDALHSSIPATTEYFNREDDDVMHEPDKNST